MADAVRAMGFERAISARTASFPELGGQSIEGMGDAATDDSEGSVAEAGYLKAVS